MLKKNKAFSLVELLLATAIMGIVLMSVYSSFSLAMRTWKRVQTKNDNNAAQVLIALTRQLRGAYLFPDQDPAFGFQGSLSSLSFTTTAIIDDDIYVADSTDLRKVSYMMRTAQNTGQRALSYEVYDVLGKNKENFKQKNLSNIMRSISFAFYDGEKWQKAWDSTIKLPQAVKIRADFQQGVYKDAYETVAVIHCADKGQINSL
ncbi:MAG: type II secretion system protein GspJ [Candidatus Omnitrophota bacterium]